MNTPKLRFKEFSEEWKTFKMKNFLTIGSGRDYKHLGNGEVPVYGTGGLMTKVDDYLYDGDTVCIGRKGTIDKPLFHKGKIWTVDTLFYTHSFKDTKPYYVYLLFQRVNWKQHNEAGGVPSLAKSTIENIEFNLPSLLEQEKITSFFTAVDKKLTLLKEKKEKLETYKKGVMQQIFSQKLRFKDDQGKSFPEWEEKTLGEIVSVTTGRLDANAMVENGKYRFYTCAKDFYFIDKYAFDMEALLISGNGANVGYIHHYQGKFNAYQRTYVLGEFINISVKYLKYFLERNLSVRINKEKKAGNTPYIVLGTLTEMIIILPTLKEQEKIAQFLKALDDKIELISQQITKTELWKKGLLQQMFV
ncbi:restriction endonuclease subunit S [Chryseobacterium sp. TY3]